MLKIMPSSLPLPLSLSPESDSTMSTGSRLSSHPHSNVTSPPPSTSVAPPPPLRPSRFPPPPLRPSRSPPPPIEESPPPRKRRSPPPKHMSPPSIPRSPPEEKFMTTTVVMVIAGTAVALLVILSLICVCGCRKKKMKPPPLVVYDDALPPNKDYPYARPQNWQQSAPPLEDHVITLPPRSPIPQLDDPRSPRHSAYSSSGSMPQSSTHGTLLPTPSFSTMTRCLFSYEELAFATNGFSESNLLGQGGFGYVHKGILPNGQEVAIKQLKAGSKQGEREFQAEVEIISRVHHKHLVSLVGYCIAGDERLLVYEFVPNKTLEYHLHGEGLPTMDWPTRLKIALGASKGLAYLHEDCHPRIIHRDVKASNILLDFDFEAMVADFGLARIASDNSSHVSTRVMGTFGYMAPEYASSGKLTDKSDVFSFGVMLLELITGKRPIEPASNDMDDSLVDWARPLLTRAMDFGNYDEIVDHRLAKNYNPDEMARMIACAASCVRHSARRRPKMSQIVRALEGDVSLDDLSKDTKPNLTSYGSTGESDHDSSQHNKDMVISRKMGLSSREFNSSEHSASTSYRYGRLYSAASSEGRNTREMEKIKEDCHEV